MGIMSRLNRLDAKFAPGARRPGESDLAWIERVASTSQWVAGSWWVAGTLARQVTSLEKRVAELERQLAERG